MPKSKVRKKAQQKLDRERQDGRGVNSTWADSCCPQPSSLSAPDPSSNPQELSPTGTAAPDRAKGQDVRGVQGERRAFLTGVFYR